jgi:Ala-tRNA(Pro) deacylase
VVQFRLAAPPRFLPIPMNNLFAFLDQLQIPYEKHEHAAVFTIEDSKLIEEHKLPGIRAKSLFLRNAKGTQHYLVSMDGDKRLNIKDLEKILGETKISFASPERLMKYLGVTPGSVSPFALINDTEKHVKVFLDADVFAHEQVQFHPLVNTATLVLSSKDMVRFIEATGHHYTVQSL